jgi:hypothetical protein
MKTRRPSDRQVRLPFNAETVDDRVSHNHVPVRKSTFLAGVSVPVHRWFRLTPSYGPDLVQKMLSDMATERRHIVLDPFCGAGTTVIECKMEGIQSIGFEVNPLLHFVCEASTQWSLEVASLKAAHLRIGERFAGDRKRWEGKSSRQIDIRLPQIHNVNRWWRDDILKELVLLREVIDSECNDDSTRSFFRLGLAGVLVPDLTNVTLGRLQLHFIDRSGDTIDVWETYHAHVARMLADLAAISDDARSVPSRVYCLDSTSDAVLQISHKVDRVITSPPYPNRYSYVWNTRPHLYLLGIFDRSSQAATLDLKTIGGTWGTATSSLMKGTVEPAYPVIEEVVTPVASEIRKADNLMANYLLHYFNRLAQQIVSQSRILADNGRCAYVVGCSRLKGVYVETDVLLGKIFEGLRLGFRTSRIERIRKRHSGKDLHESIVYADR